jgi:branched-chain amino acid transport system permease protein
VVDDPDLAALAGASPARSARLGWAMGAALAALAGILLAPLVNLETTTLTLLVINGYAAAMVGRLANLPLTFAGGLLLGLAEAYAVGYLPVGDLLSQVKPIVPMLFLFVILLLLPQSRLHGRIPLPAPPHVPGLRRSVTAAAAFMLVAGVLSGWLSLPHLDIASHGVALAVVALSLVPLAGYGGQVALCQLTFAGLGAFAMSKVGGATGSMIGVLAAVLLAGAVGTVIALPALRLRGLYLALATLAFAYGMDFAFFANPRVFTEFQALPVARVGLPGVATDDDRTYFLLLCGVFAVAALGVLALRRSTYGRRLVAMGDSPAACATIGMNLTAVKLSVFAGSAGLAGLGGALYGGQQGLVGPADFTLLQSLVLLLLVVVMGMRTVIGPLIAGLGLALGPLLQSWMPPSLREIVYLAVGAAAIGIGANPNGLVGRTPLARWREHRGRAGTGDRLPTTVSTVPELERHAAG